MPDTNDEIQPWTGAMPAQDTPVALCDKCHRHTWDPRNVDGKPCRMVQPDGALCTGKFYAPAPEHKTHHPARNECPICATPLKGEIELTDDQIRTAMRSYLRSLDLEMNVVDIVHTGPWAYSMRMEGSDMGDPMPGESADAYHERIQRISASKNPPNQVQLRWEIEGIAYVELEHTMTPSRMNVQSLWVDPEYQNLGIGTALMNIVHHEVDQCGVELWLVPQPMPGHDEDLWRFYSRLGYEKFGGSGYWIRKSPTTDREN